jgi:hypothetical protein
MGWHNIHEAGIDRRGTNCAINALLVQTKRAMAELESLGGDHSLAAALRQSAEAIAKRIREVFFDSSKHLFVDGMVDGDRLSQFSEQTNTWSVAARACDDETARTALRTVVATDDPSIARCGSYFWTYLYPQLTRLGLADLALRKTTELWGRMIDSGATLLWETFAGDDLDSWCHPWSGAPIEFLLTHLAGLPWRRPAGGPLQLRPRYDLLARCSASMISGAGELAIRWERRDGQVELHATLPRGVEAELISVEGKVVGTTRDGEIIAKISS